MSGRRLELFGGALLLAILALLVVPRLRQHEHPAPPPPRERVATDDGADRALLELEALPVDTPEQIHDVLQRWSAFAETHGDEHRAYAAAARARLEHRLAALAIPASSRLWAVLVRLEAAREFDKCRAAIAEFAKRFPGSPTLVQLEPWRKRIERAAARPILGQHRISFRHMLRGEMKQRPAMTSMVLLGATQLGASKYGLHLGSPGRSELLLGFETAEVPPAATLEAILLGGLYNHQRINCPLTLKVNGRIVFREWRPRNDKEQVHSWPIGEYLRAGKNTVSLSLDRMANTPCFVIDLAVIRHR